VRTVRDRLEDIVEAIHRIAEEAKLGREHFMTDRRSQVWMVHHIQIVGEAVRSISDQLKAMDPDYPWSQVVGMRHILVHDYFGIDLDEVWNVVEKDLPELEARVRRHLAALSGDA
jgi:uncharacterized protein with HEPN domain